MASAAASGLLDSEHFRADGESEVAAGEKDLRPNRAEKAEHPRQKAAVEMALTSGKMPGATSFWPVTATVGESTLIGCDNLRW